MIEVLYGNILLKWYMYMYFFLKIFSRIKLDDLIMISWSVDFVLDLVIRVLDVKVVMFNVLLFSDVKCIV